ncbi:MAG: hypothetical protein V3S69_02580 [Dehalococcoidales bacterium]
MAKVLTDETGITHLRGATDFLCDSSESPANANVTDGVLTCPECAKIALNAVELVTKAEKREWRKL